MIWVLIVLLALITIVLLSGKGSFLIAGYNTASKKERARYNEKRLGRVMGGGTGIMTLLLIPGALYEEELPEFWVGVMGIGIVVVVIAMIVLTSTVCRNKTVIEVEETEADRKRKRRSNIISISLAVLIMLVVGVLLFTGNVTINVQGESINIDASYWRDDSILLSDIRSVEYMEGLSVGRRTNGMGNYHLKEGHFKNQTFGKYILYSYNKCKSYVVLDTKDGIVVLNRKTAEETQKLYDEIIQSTGK